MAQVILRYAYTVIGNRHFYPYCERLRAALLIFLRLMVKDPPSREYSYVVQKTVNDGIDPIKIGRRSAANFFQLLS